MPAIPLESLRFIGSGLNRPECVLATARGDLYAADWRGGVARIAPDGSHELYAGGFPGGRPLRPNGIALRRNGSFLLADLGETQGGVFELFRDGRVSRSWSKRTASSCRRRTSSPRTPPGGSGSR